MPSHGSLTKAGKVRGHTLELQKAGLMPKAKHKKNLAPRPRNRKEYIRHLAFKIKPFVLKLADEYRVKPLEMINYLLDNMKPLVEEVRLKEYPRDIRQALLFLRREFK